MGLFGDNSAALAPRQQDILSALVGMQKGGPALSGAVGMGIGGFNGGSEAVICQQQLIEAQQQRRPADSLPISFVRYHKPSEPTRIIDELRNEIDDWIALN